MSVKETLEQLDGILSARLTEVQKQAEEVKEDLDAIRALRISVQRRAEDLERTHNSMAAHVAKIASEYERLATLRERAANAMALKPPESPQAPKRAVRAIKDVPRLKQELFAAATEIQLTEPICGVYFLLMDSEVVYVGQSVNIQSRLASHITDGTKKFNRWCYIKVKRGDLNEIEGFYITLLRPKFNKAGKPVLTVVSDPVFADQEAA